MTSDDTASALSHFRDVMGDIGDSYIPDSVERAEMIGHVMVAAGELLDCSLAEAERALTAAPTPAAVSPTEEAGDG